MQKDYHNQLRMTFIDHVAEKAGEMVFPVGRENAISLIELTLYVLKEYSHKEIETILAPNGTTRRKFKPYKNTKYL